MVRPRGRPAEAGGRVSERGGMAALFSVLAVSAILAAGAASASTPTAGPDPETIQVAEEILAREEPVNALQVLVEAGETGVAITWSDDFSLNCGVTPEHLGGCFQPNFPDTIILSPRLQGESLCYVTLHELAHVHQYRAGLPLDECAADAQALAWGADPAHAYYAPNC